MKPINKMRLSNNTPAGKGSLAIQMQFAIVPESTRTNTRGSFRKTLLLLFIMITFGYAKVFGQCTPSIVEGASITGCGSVKINADETGLTGIPMYQWFDAFSPLIGETNSQLIVTTSGSYHYVRTGGTSCDGTSGIIVVTVNPNPTPVISMISAIHFCGSGTVEMTTTTGYATYNWNKSVGTIASPFLTTLIDANSYIGVTSYTVDVSDGNGCTATSDPVNITIDTVPVPQVQFCGGYASTLVTYDAYTWTSDASTLYSGSSTSYYLGGSDADYSDLTVNVTDDNGCSGSSTPLVLHVVGNSGYWHGTYTTPAYYIVSSATTYTVTIDADLSVDYGTIIFDQTEQLYVAATGVSGVSFTHSHLFSCDNMWTGILDQWPVPLTVTNCLIEDAATAIQMSSISPSTYDYSYGLLDIEHNYFNRNNTSIYFNGTWGAFYTPGEPGPALISDNIFTSRNLCAYPYTSWPSSSLAIYAGLPRNFDIEKYGSALCKDGSTPQIGINLTGAGQTSSSGRGTGFTELVVGDGYHVNTFDTLNYGIYATQSNFASLGNICNKIWKVPFTLYGGVGIFGVADSTYDRRARIDWNTEGDSSRFCNIGMNAVETQNYAWVSGDHSAMTGVNFIGYYNNSDHFLSAAYIHNNIQFSAFAVISKVQPNTSGMYPSELAGAVQIQWNTIGKVSDTVAFPLAIGVADDGTTDHPNNGDVHIADNLITYPEAGISCDNLKWGQLAYIQDNNIVVADIARGGSVFGVPQYGIHTSLCDYASIIGNTIDGTYGAPGYDTSLKGVFVEDCTNEIVTCNAVTHAVIGFEFRNADGHFTWKGNSVDAGDHFSDYGLVISGSGGLGTQGDASHGVLDTWSGTFNGDETFMRGGASALNSILYLTTLPTGNFHVGTATAYASGTSLQTATTDEDGICDLAKRGSTSIANSAHSKQAYLLSPNPGDGDITLTQLVPDNGPVSIEIEDASGRIICNKQLTFANLNGNVNITNALPGFYVVRLRDNKGNASVYKYILRK